MRLSSYIIVLWSVCCTTQVWSQQSRLWQDALEQRLYSSLPKSSVDVSAEISEKAKSLLDAWSLLETGRPLDWGYGSVSVPEDKVCSDFLFKIRPYLSSLDRVEFWAQNWDMFPEGPLQQQSFDVSQLAERLKLDVHLLDVFFQITPPTSWLPLAAWHQLPWYNLQKKTRLLELTQQYILMIARKKSVTSLESQDFLQQWIHASALIRDFEYHLQPWPEDDVQALMEHPTSGFHDVNRVDMGIEFTAQFPFQDQAKFEKSADKSKVWTGYGAHYDFASRQVFIKSMAQKLAQHLKHPGVVEQQRVVSGHGHGIDVVYRVQETPDAAWRVEWDGVMRDYSSSGQVIYGSERNGHVELVTPKMVPDADMIHRVFATFAQADAYPRRENGGGHVNVDLSPFDARPDAMVRWLQVFHRWRGTLALLFQHPTRMPAAEPVNLTGEKKFQQKILSWQGDELALKRLLYQHRYFNRRMYRKPRYVQMDLSYYFQDIIKDKFYKPDFDVKSPTMVWRAQFRLEPQVRKMELRMMDAPRHPFESALQIRVVRAMLDYALNQDTKQQWGHRIQEVDYGYALRHVEHEKRLLKQMTDELNLPYEALEWKLMDSIASLQQQDPRKIAYKERLKKMYPQTQNKIWGGASRQKIDRDGVWHKLERTFLKSRLDDRAHSKQKKRALKAQLAEDYRHFVRYQSKVLFLRLGGVVPLESFTRSWSRVAGMMERPLVQTSLELLRKYDDLLQMRGMRYWIIDALQDFVEARLRGERGKPEAKNLKSMFENLEARWLDKADFLYQNFLQACRDT